MLTIDNLHVSIDGKAILNGINLDVRAGEVHAIMGPNGSGKSTLSAAVAGNESYEVVKGDILFSESLKTEEGADINGYLKKTESTSMEAAQNEFKLDTIESSGLKEKDKEICTK